MPSKGRPTLPPDPSRPDTLQTAIRQEVYNFLRDPSQYPDEMTSYIASFVSLNSIQSTTA